MSGEKNTLVDLACIHEPRVTPVYNVVVNVVLVLKQNGIKKNIYN